MAGGIRRVQREFFTGVGDEEVHTESGDASPQAHLRRGVYGVAEKLRDRIRLAICIWVNQRRPWRDLTHPPKAYPTLKRGANQLCAYGALNRGTSRQDLINIDPLRGIVARVACDTEPISLA